MSSFTFNQFEVVVLDGEVVEVYFLTSDLFAWGYADWEAIADDEMLGNLHGVWKSRGVAGMQAWWCKKQEQKPQWPVEEAWRKSGVWDAELEALLECEYDVAIGRWKDHPKPPWRQP